MSLLSTYSIIPTQSYLNHLDSLKVLSMLACAGKMDEVENADFSLNKKCYVKSLLQKMISCRTCFRKGNIKECTSEGRYHDAESNTKKHIGNQPIM